MTRARSRYWSLYPLVVLATLAGCIVSGFELSDTSGSSASGASCDSVRWPEPPGQTTPQAGEADIVVALRHMDFGEENLLKGPTKGYDLDQRCTCKGDKNSCLIPDYAGADHCDGPGGVDNAVAQLFAALSVFSSGLTSKKQSESSEAGYWSLLIRIRDYNGQPNDNQVSVALFASPGVDANSCTPNTAKWDGQDEFPVDASSLEGQPVTMPDMCGKVSGQSLEMPRYHDEQAYVSNGKLVANLPAAGLGFAGNSSSTTIRLVAGFISGKLVKTNGRWRLDEGLFVGRWRLDDFFLALSSLTTDNEPVCTDHPLYSALKNAACSYTDIASSLGGPTTPCDALSFGMAFDAEPAKLGIITQKPMAITQCPIATNPAFDSCDK